MNTEQIFNQIGINPLKAVSLMENLDISIEQLNDPYVIYRLESIVDFLKNYDDDSQSFFIKKATLGKQDKLKVLSEYIKLIEKRNFFEKVSDEINREKESNLNSNDLLKMKEIQEKESANNARLSLLKEEIELYHK